MSGYHVSLFFHVNPLFCPAMSISRDDSEHDHEGLDYEAEADKGQQGEAYDGYGHVYKDLDVDGAPVGDVLIDDPSVASVEKEPALTVEQAAAIPESDLSMILCTAHIITSELLMVHMRLAYALTASNKSWTKGKSLMTTYPVVITS